MKFSQLFVDKSGARIVRRVLSAVAVFLPILSGCDDGVGPDVVASLQISPASAISITVGDTLTLRTQLLNGRGAALEGRELAWTTSASGVAMVNQRGVVRGVGAGTA